MKFFKNIKNVFVLGRKYDYSYVFKAILHKIFLFAQVHKLIQLGFRVRGVNLNACSNRSVLIMNELRRQLFHQNGKKVLQDLDAIFQKHSIVYG